MVIGGGITRVTDLAAVVPELGQYRRLKNYWFPMIAIMSVRAFDHARVADRREESDIRFGKQWQITADDN